MAARRASSRRRGAIEVDRFVQPSNRPKPQPAMQSPHNPDVITQRHVSYEASGHSEKLLVSVPVSLTDDADVLSPPLPEGLKSMDDFDNYDPERGEEHNQRLELEGLGHLSSVASIPENVLRNKDGSIRKRRRTQAIVYILSFPLIIS